MITQKGFVLCEVAGEYEDVEITNLAFSDNEPELENLIYHLHGEPEIPTFQIRKL